MTTFHFHHTRPVLLQNSPFEVDTLSQNLREIHAAGAIKKSVSQCGSGRAMPDLTRGLAGDSLGPQNLEDMRLQVRFMIFLLA